MGKARIAVALVVVLLVGIYAGQSGSLAKLENEISTGLAGVSSAGNAGQSSQQASSVATMSSHVGGYSATPVTDIYSAYTSNAASANSQYSGKTIDVDGSVDDVEQSSGGGYQSCILATSDGTVYGCQLLAEVGGYIVWNWASQAAASKVVFDTTIVAQCTIAGLEDSNLVLNNCTIIDIPSQDQAAQEESYCSSLVGGISITNLTIVAPKGGIEYARNNNVNMSMTVSNSNTFPIGLATATASLGYTNVAPVDVGIYTSQLVNASSHLLMKLVITQTTFDQQTVLSGDSVQLTLEFGEGQQHAGSFGISNPCPVTVSGTASPTPAASTSTTTTQVPADGGFSQASFYIFGIGPSFNGTSFTCASSTSFGTTAESWVEMTNDGSFPVSVLNLTLTFGGDSHTYKAQTPCAIPGTYPTLAGEFLNLGTMVYFPIAPQPQESYTGLAVLSNGQQVTFSGEF